MSINAVKLEASEGPELDLSQSPLSGLASSVKAFVEVTNPPYIIYTDMTDESAEIVRNTLDEAFETHGVLWSRWGHNQWRIREGESE